MIIYAPDNSVLLEIEVDDTSYQYCEVMNRDDITLEFALAEYVELPIGAHIVWGSKTYQLLTLPTVEIVNNRNFKYTATFETDQGKMRLWVVHNQVDGRVKFELTAYPSEHLQLLIDNLNEHEGVELWRLSTGGFDSERIALSYNLTTIQDALTQLAAKCETEWEVYKSGDYIYLSLGKVEYNADAPLALRYGADEGLESGVTRKNNGDGLPVEVLYIQGGERNIDSSDYHGYSNTLLLPRSKTFGFDGEYFSWESQYEGGSRVGVQMRTDSKGYSIRLASATSLSAEMSLDLSDIYPHYEGEIAQVITTDSGGDFPFYDIVDSELGENGRNIDFNELVIPGTTPVIAFQGGMLAGREIGWYNENGSIGFELGATSGKFKLAQETIDGMIMPGEGGFIPRVGDKYIVLGVMMPSDYIGNDTSHTGAEYEMLREAARYLYKNCKSTQSFTGRLSGIYAKRHWNEIGAKLRLGGRVDFSDASVQATALPMRIMSIKTYLNSPYKPEIELSDEPTKGTVGSAIQTLKNNFARTDQQIYDSRRYTARNFRDARETMQMLQQALIYGFTEGIYPITVQTMQQIVGSEALQFRFVASRFNPTAVSHTFTYDKGAKKLRTGAGTIQHMTLGISDISSQHDYRFWDISAYESPELIDGKKKYYLYAKCEKSGNNATFRLSETAIDIEGEAGYYNLLVGILNSEYEGDRSFSEMYGYTEILPGRIVVDRIVSGSGLSYLDLVHNTLMLNDGRGCSLAFKDAPEGGKQLVIEGAFVQSGGGAVPISAYTGVWSATRVYQKGDEAIGTVDGLTSIYEYINDYRTSGHPVSDTNYWRIKVEGARGADGTDGRDGEDGAPALIAELSTNTGAIPVASDGLTRAQMTVQTTATMRLGGALQALTGITVSGLPAGVTSSQTVATGTISFVIANNTNLPARSEITIALTSGENSATLTFTLVAIRAGEDGEDGLSPVVASLLPNVSEVHRTEGGSYSASGISCQIKIKEGEQPEQIINYTEPGDYRLTYQIDNGTETDYSVLLEQEPSYIEPVLVQTQVIFRLYILNADGETYTLIETRNICIVRDGATGQQGTPGTPGASGAPGRGIATIVTYYAIAMDGNTKPSSGWTTSLDWSTVQQGQWVWMYDLITYSDGTEQVQDYPPQRKARDGARGADGTNGPATLYCGTWNAETLYYADSLRCDIVWYSYHDGEQTVSNYYIANPAACAENGGRVPVGHHPATAGETYWNKFASSVDTLAAGWIFAEKATFENAIVRRLITWENTTKPRIICEEDHLVAYAQGGDARVLVTGEVLAAQTLPPSPSLGSVLLSHVWNTGTIEPGGEEVDQTIKATYGGSTLITIDNGANVVNLPQRSITLQLNAASQLPAGFQVSFGCEWVIDEGQATELTYGGAGAVLYVKDNDLTDTTIITLAAESITLSKGAHTIGIRTRALAEYSDAGVVPAQSINVTGNAFASGSANISITYAEQITELGANGLRARFASNQYFELLNTGSSASPAMSFIVRNGQYGFRILADGIKMTTDGGVTWNNVGSGGGTTTSAYVNLNGNVTELTSAVNLFAPTTAGTRGYFLRSNGSGAPSWASADSLLMGYRSLMGGEEIVSGDDLDLIVNVGNYYVVSNNSNIANSPFPNKAGVLKVSLMNGVTANYILQEWSNFDSIDTFVRYTNDGGTTWSDWLSVTDGAVMDMRSTNTTPGYFGRAARFMFKQNNLAIEGSLNDGGGYFGSLHFAPWGDNSECKAHQLAFTDNGNLWHRTAQDASNWGGWDKILSANNYASVLNTVYHPKGGNSQQALASADLRVSQDIHILTPGSKIYFATSGESDVAYIYFDESTNKFWLSHEWEIEEQPTRKRT